MNKTHIAFSLLFAVALTACHKKEPVDAAVPAPAAAVPAAAAPAPAPEQTPEEHERAQKQDKLDFATMEDGYINDAHGQWAQAAKASSTFGDDDGKTPSEASLAANATGAPDDKSWSNNHQDMGLDWLEAQYARPAPATAVRIVCNDSGVKSISKLELQDDTGKWNTVWSGLSDVQADKRGPRNWFVKAFPKTPYPVKAVKVTFANNVDTGFKEVDAIQLIGE